MGLCYPQSTILRFDYVSWLGRCSGVTVSKVNDLVLDLATAVGMRSPKFDHDYRLDHCREAAISSPPPRDLTVSQFGHCSGNPVSNAEDGEDSHPVRPRVQESAAELEPFPAVCWKLDRPRRMRGEPKRYPYSRHMHAIL